MKFQHKGEETLFVSEIVPERSYMFNQDLKTGLSVIWNTGKKAEFIIDNQKIHLENQEVIFLTEFHQIEKFTFKKLNVLQFNKSFYCVENHDTAVGCKGILFFGASDIPKIKIQKDHVKQFGFIWEIVLMEMEENDDLKLEMLRVLVKRFLILSLRLYKNQNINPRIKSDATSIGIIREFNFLVENHYKTYTKVSDYANLLHKSPKTLSNIFKKYIDKSPLQIINDRRFLEAKRLLNNSDLHIQEIADELNFSDIQAFSNFFKTKEKISPKQYKERKLNLV